MQCIRCHLTFVLIMQTAIHHRPPYSLGMHLDTSTRTFSCILHWTQGRYGAGAFRSTHRVFAGGIVDISERIGFLSHAYRLVLPTTLSASAALSCDMSKCLRITCLCSCTYPRCYRQLIWWSKAFLTAIQFIRKTHAALLGASYSNALLALAGTHFPRFSWTVGEFHLLHYAQCMMLPVQLRILRPAPMQQLGQLTLVRSSALCVKMYSTAEHSTSHSCG